MSETPGMQTIEKIPVKMRVLGRWETVLMEPAQAAAIKRGAREWIKKKRGLTKAAKEAIVRLRGSDAQDFDAAVEAIHQCCYVESSENRLSVLLNLAASAAPAGVFWRVFLNQWPDCDDTWKHRQRLLRVLRQHARQRSRYFKDEQRQFLDQLPSVVIVHRGCSNARVAGISWTTDEDVARNFATGHRGLRIPDPVVATGSIRKEHIFAVFTNRCESEVLLDPDRLERLQICNL